MCVILNFDFIWIPFSFRTTQTHTDRKQTNNELNNNFWSASDWDWAKLEYSALARCLARKLVQPVLEWPAASHRAPNRRTNKMRSPTSSIWTCVANLKLNYCWPASNISDSGLHLRSTQLQWHLRPRKAHSYARHIDIAHEPGRTLAEKKLKWMDKTNKLVVARLMTATAAAASATMTPAFVVVSHRIKWFYFHIWTHRQCAMVTRISLCRNWTKKKKKKLMTLGRRRVHWNENTKNTTNKNWYRLVGARWWDESYLFTLLFAASARFGRFSLFFFFSFRVRFDFLRSTFPLVCAIALGLLNWNA